MRYLELEDIVVQAFIYYTTKTHKRSLSIESILEYGRLVTKQVNKNSNNYTVMERMTYSKMENLFEKYDDYFIFLNEKLVVLRHNVTIEDLTNIKFFYSKEVKDAFQNKENCKVLEVLNT